MFETFYGNAIGRYLPEFTILENTLNDYVYSLLLFVVLTAIFALLYKGVLMKARKWAQKTQTDWDNVLVEVVESVQPPFYIFLAFYIALQTLVLGDVVQTIVSIILYLWIAYHMISALTRLTSFVVRRNIESETGDEALATARFLIGLVKWVLWAIALLLILSNFGVEVTSLIAGLGIGGIAIAFALQNILADLFSSFAIYFDKPFQVGDFIKVGDFLGEVQKVGIKTTRVKSLSGEELIFANQDLTSSKIQNYGRMQERRIQFNFGITYQTPKDKLEAIPQTIQSIVERTPNTRFDRAHFKEFADSSLGFEVVYFVLSDDYNKYMDIQQAINLGLVDEFEKEGIDFAYPTRTVFIEKEDK